MCNYNVKIQMINNFSDNPQKHQVILYKVETFKVKYCSSTFFVSCKR